MRRGIRVASGIARHESTASPRTILRECPTHHARRCNTEDMTFRYDVQSYQPSVDPGDPLGSAGSTVDLLEWLNTHGEEVVSLTAVPQTVGAPIYVVVWRMEDK